MAAMVEAGALPGLLRHLANGQFSQPSNKAPREEDMAFGHRDADESDHEDDQSPSVLLAARLLYAFSSNPGVRCVSLYLRSRVGREVAACVSRWLHACLRATLVQ